MSSWNTCLPANGTSNATDPLSIRRTTMRADAVLLGKVERFNRTLQAEWAYRQGSASSAERIQALDPWLKYYNSERIHSGIRTTTSTATG